MHKEGGSFEIRNGQRVKIDQDRRAELMAGGSKKVDPAPAMESDVTASTKPAGGGDVKTSKSTKGVD